MPAFLAFIAVVLLASFAFFWSKYTRLRRAAFIREAELPRGLFEKLRAKHPQLSTKDCQLVAHGLRQFFLAHLKSGRQFVSMPSQVVDDLWHEFILYTKNYDAYCRSAFGRFLHHSPAVVLGSERQRNAGLRRCWWFACKEENINPRAPTRLPLLFALDTKLNIPGGFHYVPDCSGVRRAHDGNDGQAGAATYCGGDFSSDAFDGGTAGFSDGASDGGGSSSDGGDGGGGGDGCGGGGCGGGGD